MAVQKTRKTRSKRDMRRAHDALTFTTLATNERGALHQRHHLAADGTYRGKQILDIKQRDTANEEEQA